MGQPDAGQLLAVAVDVARRAADLARTARAEAVGEIDTKSTATDVVTMADRAVERLIVELLGARRPGEPVLGEEYGVSADAPAGAELPEQVRWVVDPIDGTVNYVYGLPQYAVSIAAQVAGASVAAVVLNAATGEEWTAVRGAGAYRAGRRLRASTQDDLSQALIATGFGYDAARRAYQAGVLTSVLRRVRDIRRFGAASLDLCFAAEGLVDAYYEKGLHLWDHAAGGLIAEEAGLRVSGLRGAPPGLPMVLAAPPALYGPLHALLVELEADAGP